eukprot:3982129-Pleurochrysis_carterae.AAC.3
MKIVLSDCRLKARPTYRPVGERCHHNGSCQQTELRAFCFGLSANTQRRAAGEWHRIAEPEHSLKRAAALVCARA